jgi:photosystem II stability/assembly factor-like uncharacterized protein
MIWSPVLIFRSNSLNLAQSVSNPNVLYLGSTDERMNGTLLKSINGGQTWVRIGANDVKWTIRDIAIDPQNPEWIYILTDTAGGAFCLGCQVLASRNGGNSWGDITPHLQTDRFNAGAPCRFLQTDHSKPGYIAAGCNRSAQDVSDLVESSDGGVTWQVENFPGLASSFRNGDSFHDVENNLWWYLAVHPGNPQGILGINSAVGDHYDHRAGMVISRDGGKNWSDISIHPKEGRVIDVNTLSWSESDPDRILFGSGGGTYATFNGGRTWEKALPYPTSAITELGSGRLLAATRFGVFTSPDKGHSWHESSFGLPAYFGDLNPDDPNHFLGGFDEGNSSPGVMLEAYDDGTVYVGAQGGYWTSQDGGLTWSWHNVKSGLQQVGTNDSDIIPQFHGPNVRQLIIAADKTMFLNMVVQGSFWQGGSEILKLQPDGKTVTIKTPVASNQISISASDSNVLYVTASSIGRYQKPYDGDQLIKSDDGGFSWQTISLIPWLKPALKGFQVASIPVVLNPSRTSNVCFVVAVVHNNYSGATESILFETDNGGKTWKDISPPQLSTAPQGRLKFAVDADGKGLYLLLTNDLLHSSDGGVRWTKLSLNALSLLDIAVNPQSTGTVYASGISGVWASKDAGLNWLLIGNGAPGDRLERILPSSGMIFAEGFGGIYRSAGSDGESIESKWQELDKNSALDPLGVALITR